MSHREVWVTYSLATRKNRFKMRSKLPYNRNSPVTRMKWFRSRRFANSSEYSSVQRGGYAGERSSIGMTMPGQRPEGTTARSVCRSEKMLAWDVRGAAGVPHPLQHQLRGVTVGSQCPPPLPPVQYPTVCVTFRFCLSTPPSPLPVPLPIFLSSLGVCRQGTVQSQGGIRRTHLQIDS